jgi:adenine-specific DNA-methyltransferase
LVVAERLGRRWIGVDLGRYERQWWQKERLKGADEEHRRVVLEFYRAELLLNSTGLLHGRKGQAFVHVDGIDRIFSRNELRQVVKAAREPGLKKSIAWPGNSRWTFG